MSSANDPLARARAHLDRGEYDQAIALCTEAICLDPHAAWAFLCRGVARDFKAGRFSFGDQFTMSFLHPRAAQDAQGGPDLAIADFTEAIRLDPHNPVAYGNRGNDYLATGQYPQAVADYSEAIRLEPANPARFVARAHAYLALDWDRAIADFDEAIRMDPRDPNLHVSRVNAFGKERRWREVIAELTEAIRTDPANALAYALRATAHNGMNRFDRSIPDADEAIRLDPQLFLGFDARGYGYLQRGNPAPGGRTGTGCLSFLAILAVGAVPCFLLGAAIAYLTGDADLFPKLPIILAFPGALVSWFFLGFLPALARQKRDLRQAVADFTRALELRPNDAGCYLGRSLAYRALGELDNAARDALAMRTTADAAKASRLAGPSPPPPAARDTDG
jgi:tetratricopeptide (TPR) repeat protein